MSANLRILNAQSDLHNLQCQVSLLKRLISGPESEISLNEYEVEGMIDQLDEAFDRLEILHGKLETMKQDMSDHARFDTLQEAGNVIAILAKSRATHKKHRVSTPSGNGNGNRKLHDIPNISA